MSIFHFFQRLCQRGFKSKKANRNEELSNMLPKLVVKESYTTSHSAYVATDTELLGAKIDGSL